MSGSSQRSAIGGDTKFNYSPDQLNSITRELTQGYVLVDHNGRIWTSAPDSTAAQKMLNQAVQTVGNKQSQPASFGG